jgi:putative oxidoreductase
VSLVQGVIEVVGGILLLVGGYTRVVAFILADNMAVAYFMAHFPRSFFPAMNGGDAAVLFWKNMKCSLRPLLVFQR